MAGKGIRANTETANNIGAEVTGTPLTGEKHALDVAVKESIGFTGEVNINSPGTSGLVSKISVVSGSWTALPATALTDRKGLSIQNNSGSPIYLNFSTGAAALDSIFLDDGAERFYNIADSLTIYGRLASGGPADIIIEEIA